MADKRLYDLDVATLTSAHSIPVDIAGNAEADRVTVASLLAFLLADTSTPELIRDTIGTALTAGSGISITVSDAGDTITIASSVTQYTDEMARDALGTALVAGSNVTITVDDNANTITIAATDSVPFTPASTAPTITADGEGWVKDTDGSAYVSLDGVWVQIGGGSGGATNLAYTAASGGGTVTSDTGTDALIPLADGTNAGLMAPAQYTKLDGIASGATAYTDEMARDAIGTALTAGTGITITPNDGADTITVASSITQYTDEMARDAIGTALVAGSGMTITVSDVGDTITLAASGGGGSIGPMPRAGGWVRSLGSTAAGAGFSALTQNQEICVPILLPAGTIDRLGTYISAGAASSVLRFGLRNDSNGYPGSVLVDGGTVATTTGGSFVNVTVSTTISTPGLYWLSFTAQGAGGATIIKGLPSWGHLIASSSESSPFFWGDHTYVQTGVTGSLGSFSATVTMGSFWPLGQVRYA